MNTNASLPKGILCPSCQVPLVMSERQNIEIDYCPTCRGVWLDRGELDKIIERSVTGEPKSVRQDSERHDRGNEYSSHSGRNIDYGHRDHHRRKSWLREIFD